METSPTKSDDDTARIGLQWGRSFRLRWRQAKLEAAAAARGAGGPEGRAGEPTVWWMRLMLRRFSTPAPPYWKEGGA